MRPVLVAALLLAASPFARADRCELWQPPGAPVLLESCSYEDGKSGYYQVTNQGLFPATVCWEMEYSDGRRQSLCHSGLGAGKKDSGSCFFCGGRNLGVRNMRLTRYEKR